MNLVHSCTPCRLTATAIIAGAFQCVVLGQVEAATPLGAIRCSSDITILHATQTTADENVLEDDLSGGVTLVDLGPLPSPSDLDAYHLLPSGAHLISFDTSVTLPGDVSANASDIVRYDGTVYSLEFDASIAGLNEVNADSVTLDGNGDLVLSFDTTVDLDGVIVDDEDLVVFDGAHFSLFFDGSDAGVDTSLDLDAAHYLDTSGHLLVSFDSSGVIGTVAFDDEDVLEFDPILVSWDLAWDGSEQGLAWHRADLDAFSAAVACQLVPPSAPLPVNGSSICTSPGRLSWQPVPGADYHTIDIDGAIAYMCEGDPLFDGCSLPSNEVLSEGVHSWQITAHKGAYPRSNCAVSGPLWTFTVDPAVAPADEACDGLDNDCNDMVDDGLGMMICGTGECERTVDNCVAGQSQVCIPGEPAPEVCDGLDNDCNTLVDDDAAALDSDSDEVPNACDNCINVANASQSDVDGDAEGDACDLADGLIRITIANPFSVQYQLETGHTAYNVYRGRWDAFLTTGHYTQNPALVPRAARFCGETSGVVFDVFAFSEPGELLFYLVTGVTGATESGLGDGTAVARPNDNPCP